MEDTLVLNRVEGVLKKTENYLKSDEIVCACYLCKYLENYDDKYWHRFNECYNNLSLEQKDKAIRFTMIYLKNNSKKIVKMNKKIKK